MNSKTPLPKILSWYPLFLIFFLCSSPSRAQTPQFEFYDKIGDNPNLFKLNIHQDKQGFLWFSNLQQIIRYDGYNFITRLHPKPDLGIYCKSFEILERDNILLKKYDDHFNFLNFQTEQNTFASFKDILPEHAYFGKSFVHQPRKNLILFTFIDTLKNQIGISKFEQGQFIKTDKSLKYESDQFKILADGQGAFIYYNLESETLLRFHLNDLPTDRLKLPSLEFPLNRIKAGNKNPILLYGDKEIFFLDNKRGILIPHSANRFLVQIPYLRDFVETKNGDLWCVSHDKNIFYYDQEKDTLINYSNHLESLIQRKLQLQELSIDHSGVIWITSLMGILKIVPGENIFDTYFTSPSPECNDYCSFRGITEDEEGMIYSSFYNGIYKLDPLEKSYNVPFPDFTNTPYSLNYKDQHLILNNGSRINSITGQIDTSLLPLREYEIDIGVSIKDAQKNIYLNYGRKIYILNEKSLKPFWEEIVEVPDINNDIYTIHYGKNSNSIWINNYIQLFNYDIEKKTLIAHPISDDAKLIRTIYEDKDQNVWLGTEKGLTKFNPKTQEEKRYTKTEGLPDNYICTILPEGDSCLWLATNRGLSRMKINQNRFINFFAEHGLPDNEFNRASAYVSKQGQFFFGGIKGITAFYPHEVMKKYLSRQDNSKLVLSSFSFADKRQQKTIFQYNIDKEKTIELFPWNNSINIEFSQTDFRTSDKLQYSYRLDGFNDTWSQPTTTNFAYFNSLPSGNYIFRARVVDKNGRWHPNELKIRLKVHPPWWKTNLAFSVYGLLSILLFYGIYRMLLFRTTMNSQVLFEQKEAQRLKELHTLKSRLFTNLTHEFRTPLSLILGMSEHLSEEINEIKISQKHQDQLLTKNSQIQKHGQYLLQIINQMLDLSKIEHNSFQVQFQQSDIISYLAYVVSSFQVFANQQNLSLKFYSNIENLEMDFDSNLLEQILSNLLSNAIKFTPVDGNITVKVEAIQNDKLQIQVIDSGIGIPSKQFAYIFDPFYQVDSSSTRKNRGTGIGLAHTKELTKLMNGQIDVESTLGKGTTFKILFPIRQEYTKTVITSEVFPTVNYSIGESTLVNPAGDFKSSPETISLDSSSSKNKNLPKVLIIEDTPDIADYIALCLKKSFEIEIAYNGDIGIQKALESVPDIIISDVMMPGKDGFEVCKILKEDEKTSHIPIILLTAKVDTKSRLEGLQQGADAYLTKPFNKKELLTRLEQMIIRQQNIHRYYSSHYQSSETQKSSKIDNSLSLPQEDAFLKKLNTILEANYKDKNFTLPQLCLSVNMSRSQLFRKLKALIDQSPSQFIRKYRLNKAKNLIETSDLNISEVSWEVGFNSPAHFSRVFHEEFGHSPSKTHN